MFFSLSPFLTLHRGLRQSIHGFNKEKKKSRPFSAVLVSGRFEPTLSYFLFRGGKRTQFNERDCAPDNLGFRYRLL